MQNVTSNTDNTHNSNISDEDFVVKFQKAYDKIKNMFSSENTNNPDSIIGPAINSRSNHSKSIKDNNANSICISKNYTGDDIIPSDSHIFSFGNHNFLTKINKTQKIHQKKDFIYDEYYKTTYEYNRSNCSNRKQHNTGKLVRNFKQKKLDGDFNVECDQNEAPNILEKTSNMTCHSKQTLTCLNDNRTINPSFHSNIKKPQKKFLENQNAKNLGRRQVVTHGNHYPGHSKYAVVGKICSDYRHDVKKGLNFGRNSSLDCRTRTARPGLIQSEPIVATHHQNHHQDNSPNSRDNRPFSMEQLGRKFKNFINELFD